MTNAGRARLTQWPGMKLRQQKPDDGAPAVEAQPVEAKPLALDAAQLRALSSTFAPPHWLRDLGRTSWLFVGIGLLLAGVAWLLGQAAVIVGPVLVGLVVATVAAPLVSVLQRHRVPRVVGALIVLLLAIVVVVVIALLVIGGIVSQSDSISTHLSSASDEVQSWLKDAGFSTSGASSATDTAAKDVPAALSTLFHGVLTTLSGITSLAFAAVFSVFSLVFLLKDGPAFRSWVESHLGVPAPAARTITHEVISSIRHYFLGVTIVAVFNAAVVGFGALALGVPLAGTIAVVTLVTAYVPFIGAFVSGAFAVLIALGANGTRDALIMLVIVLLANGLLQNIVQPIAFGATLDLNPLLILIVTIGFGSLFGMAGLVLAAPLTSAAVHIARELGRARAAAAPSPAT